MTKMKVINQREIPKHALVQNAELVLFVDENEILVDLLQKNSKIKLVCVTRDAHKNST